MDAGSNPAAPATRNVAESHENETNTGTSAQCGVSPVSQTGPVTRAEKVRVPKVGTAIEVEGGEGGRVAAVVSAYYKRRKEIAGVRAVCPGVSVPLRLSLNSLGEQWWWPGMGLGDGADGVGDKGGVGGVEAADLGDAGGGLAGKLEGQDGVAVGELKGVAGAGEGDGLGLGHGADTLATGGGRGEGKGGTCDGEGAGSDLNAPGSIGQADESFVLESVSGEGQGKGVGRTENVDPRAFEAHADVGRAEEFGVGDVQPGVRGAVEGGRSAGEEGQGGEGKGEVSHAAGIGSSVREPESGAIPTVEMSAQDTEPSVHRPRSPICEVHGDYLPCDGCAREDGGLGDPLPPLVGCDCGAVGVKCNACVERTAKCARFGCPADRAAGSIWCSGHAKAAAAAGGGVSFTCDNLPAMPPDEAAVRSEIPEESEQPNDRDPEVAEDRWARRILSDAFEYAWEQVAEDSANDPRTVARCKRLHDLQLRELALLSKSEGTC